MHSYDLYVPVILSALTILVLGCINFKSLQIKRNGVATGYPNYMYLALISLIVGSLSVYMQSNKFKKQMRKIGLPSSLKF